MKILLNILWVLLLSIMSSSMQIIENSSSSIFNITIERKSISNDCIMGYLFIDDTPICYTLELPYLFNLKDMSSIPKGTYNAKIRTDGNRGWRIELVDVPGDRENVQIHIGNYLKEITGCTLVGLSANIDDCTVIDSKKAIQKIENEFKKFELQLMLNANSSNVYDIQVRYK